MKRKEMSKKELEVMYILWEAGKPLTVAQIICINPNLKTITVQTCLKKLLDKSYVEIAGFEQTGKTIARTFKSVLEEEEYLKQEISYYFSLSRKKETLYKNFIVALVNDVDEKAISDIEKILEEIKKEG